MEKCKVFKLVYVEDFHVLINICLTKAKVVEKNNIIYTYL